MIAGCWLLNGVFADKGRKIIFFMFPAVAFNGIACCVTHLIVLNAVQQGLRMELYLLIANKLLAISY